MECLLPEVIRQVRLPGIEPEALQRQRPRHCLRLAGVEDAHDCPFAEGLAHPQCKCGVQVAVEQVHRSCRFAPGGKDPPEDLQTRRVQIGQPVSGNQIATGESDERRGRLGLRQAE